MDGAVELSHVLIGDNKVKFEFTSLGKNLDKSFSGKILKLVDVEVEVGTLFLRLKDSVHGRKLNLGDQHSTEKGRVIFSKFSSGKIGNKDFLLVHYFLDIYLGMGMSDGTADFAGGNKLTNLVEDRGDGFGAEFLVHGVEFVNPEIFESGVS